MEDNIMTAEEAAQKAQEHLEEAITVAKQQKENMMKRLEGYQDGEAKN